MSDSADIEVLLKNIQHGLKVYGIKDLNEAITKVLYEKGDKSKAIEFVLNSVGEEYGISRQVLINSAKRREVQEARQLAYCLLYLNLGLSLREIAKDVFGKYHRTVAIAIEYYKGLNPKIPLDKKFIDTYTKQQEKLLNFINKHKDGIKDIQ